MKVVIFGASGQTGLFLVEQSLRQGHAVTAFVRTPETFPVSHDRLRVIQGDVLSSDDVAEAIEGADAVLCTIGSRGRLRVSSEGTRNIIAGMRQHSVKRLVAVTGMGAGDSRKRVAVLGRVVMGVFLGLQDKDRQEHIIRESELDWTIVRPPMLTNEPHTGSYRVGSDLKQGFASTIARADLAEFMLEQLTDDTYLHQTPTMHY